MFQGCFMGRQVYRYNIEALDKNKDVKVDGYELLIST
jgi:hypothetical protein